MSDLTLNTTQREVLVHITREPQSTIREIAAALNITERAVLKIVAKLEAMGYIERQRVGRGNIYKINPSILA